MEIHPYVRGRLRALPRQDETTGILLGTSESGVTHVTGFKRVTPSGLRQAAFDAGPALAGFYRLQTTNAPTLLPEEEELWRQFQPEGRSVFLLVKAVSGGVEATAWTRENNGPPAMEEVSLEGEFTERRKDDSPPTRRQPASRPEGPWRVLSFALIALAAVLAGFLLRPDKPVPLLSLDLQSAGNELTAVWEQQGAPAEKLQFATMSILDGAKERTMDLTRSYTSRGRITVRPVSSDVIVTLRVQYAGIPLLSRSATYVGFVPPPPPAPPTVAEPASSPIVQNNNDEIEALRKRNKELEDAVAALRKHVRQ